MPRWWNELDDVLRGRATQVESLRGGRLSISIGRFAAVLIVLGMIYGLCMGSFSIWRGLDPAAGGSAWMQMLATMIKVPALFILTLIVTFPSLYVFNALVGSRLDVATVFRLLIASLVVTVAVLASLGPIVAFFGASTTSYPFMKLLNVAVFAAAGVLGLGFLLRTLQRLSEPLEYDVNAIDASESSTRPQGHGPLEPLEGRRLSQHVQLLFRCWVVLFGLVGAQMAWVLRPFLGSPDKPFSIFRPRESNFFQAVYYTVLHLFR